MGWTPWFAPTSGDQDLLLKETNPNTFLKNITPLLSKSMKSNQPMRRSSVASNFHFCSHQDPSHYEFWILSNCVWKECGSIDHGQWFFLRQILSSFREKNLGKLWRKCVASVKIQLILLIFWRKNCQKFYITKLKQKTLGPAWLWHHFFFLAKEGWLILLVMVILLWLNVCGTQIKWFQKISMYKRWAIVSITWMIHGWYIVDILRNIGL